MFSIFHKRTLVYSEADQTLLEAYFKENLGNFDQVFHELVSPDLHIDIAVIPPTEKQDCYTLVTMGMGAYKMKVPPMLAAGGYNRAELAMQLPKDWDVFSQDERWYWPIRYLKVLARMPLNQKTWLGQGHSVDCSGPVAENTAFCSLALDLFFDDDTLPLRLTGGDSVLLYRVIPLYREEMEFKMQTSGDALFERLGNDIITSPLDLSRKNVCL